MRSRPELGAFGVMLLLATSAPILAGTQTVTQHEIDQAVAAVKKDPNLSSEKTIRTLRWDDNSKDKPREKHREPTRWPAWLSWIGDVFGWIGQTSRMLMWLVSAPPSLQHRPCWGENEYHASWHATFINGA